VWKTEGSGKTARPVNTRTGAHNMRDHKAGLRAQAEGRNQETLPEKRKAFRRVIREFIAS
jgi:hypothetical protein